MLLAFLAIAATSMAQVTTFNLIGGSNDDWVIDSYTNLNTEGRIWQTNPGGNSYVIFKATEATYIQGYTIKLNKLSVNNENNYIESGVPYTWTLYGSNNKDDDNSWVLIHSQVQANRVKEDVDNGFFKSAGKSYTYYCNSKEQYLYYKFKVTGKYGGTWGGFKMARLDLIPSSVGFSALGNGMDGDTSTKQQGGLPQSITVTGTTSARISGFQFTTANDNASWTGRNPRTIIVEGSTTGSSWTTIQSWTNYTGLEDKNYYPYVFKFNEPQEYTYYRFTFDDVTGRDRGDGTTEKYFQMSELAIITPLQISTPAYLANFASLVNTGTTGIDAILTTDIDYTAYTTGFIGTDGNRYSGTFDGQGYTVTTDIKTTIQGTGLFGSINGATIKNLVLDGSIESSKNWIGGIGGISRGDATKIQNVVVKSTIKYTGSGDSTCGGLFGDMENAFTVENCAFLGSINVGSGTHVGGLVSWTGSGTFYNCLVAPVSVTSGDTNEFSYKWGGDASSNNCYNVANNDARLASGELCYLLNGSTCYDVNWTQTLGTDSNPIPFNTHGIVNKISAARYTTQYIPTTDVTIPTGVEAYAGVISGERLSLRAISGAINKEDAVVLKGTANTYYSFVPTTGASKATNNLLGSDGNATGGANIYALANLTPEGETDPVVGFYRFTDNTKNIPAGKAYLNTSAGVKGFTFLFEDDATGLDAVNGEGFMVNGPIYNLAGQRVNKMQKGINIVNGKKILR